jgi:aquaporin TIP
VPLRAAREQLGADGAVTVRALDPGRLRRVTGHDPDRSEAPSGALRTLTAVEYDPVRRGFAELVGTFTLIFVGVGSIIFAANTDLVPVALAHGLAIAVMVSAVGHISGAHFNPAVTLGFLVTRRIAPTLAVVYWIAQLAGAVLGALALRAAFPSEAPLENGVPRLELVTSWEGVLIEAILTFFLVWVVFATAADPGGTFKSIAGLAIGLTITIDILAAGPLTGAAMNPARALGPELVFNFWDDWWVYIVGPALGGAVAALAYDWLYLREDRLPLVGEPESGLDEPRPGETAAT